MAFSMSFILYKPNLANTVTVYLSTPLYLGTLAFSLTGLILLICSGDGYHGFPKIVTYRQDDCFLFPISAMFVSAMTTALRCFFWVVSFWVEVRWVREGEIQLFDDVNEGAEEGKGTIRLRDDRDETEATTLLGKYKWVIKILLSWNAWLAATLTASLGVLLWRLYENCEGRTLMMEAACGTLCLTFAW